MPYPFDQSSDASSMLSMGLHAITNDDWVAPFDQDELNRFVRHKTVCLARDNDAVLASEYATSALAELQTLLRRHLSTQPWSSKIQRDGSGFGDSSAVSLLTQMGLWVPDDVCILQPATEIGLVGDDYVLTAVNVLSPSNWIPKDKFMKPLAQIHGPIPGFSESLTPKVTRFFNHLRVGRSVIRYNWGIQPGDALQWNAETELPIDESTPLFYRSERQSLLRLPYTGAVVFMIRIEHCLLSELNECYRNSHALSQLCDFIRRMPMQEIRYKGLHRFKFY